MHAFINIANAYVYAYMHSFICRMHAFIHACIHMFMHTWYAPIHTYMHTCPTCLFSMYWTCDADSRKSSFFNELPNNGNARLFRELPRYLFCAGLLNFFYFCDWREHLRLLWQQVMVELRWCFLQEICKLSFSLALWTIFREMKHCFLQSQPHHITVVITIKQCISN